MDETDGWDNCWGIEDVMRIAKELTDSSKICKPGFSCSECPFYDGEACMLLIISENLRRLSGTPTLL